MPARQRRHSSSKSGVLLLLLGGRSRLRSGLVGRLLRRLLGALLCGRGLGLCRLRLGGRRLRSRSRLGGRLRGGLSEEAGRESESSGEGSETNQGLLHFHLLLVTCLMHAPSEKE